MKFLWEKSSQFEGENLLAGGAGIPYTRPGPRLYLRDHSEGRLERFALLAIAPTRDEEYVNSLSVATVRRSFSSVPLTDDPSDGAPGPGLAAALPAAGPGPVAAVDGAGRRADGPGRHQHLLP